MCGMCASVGILSARGCCEALNFQGLRSFSAILSKDLLDGKDQHVDTAAFILCSVEVALGE